MRNEISRVGITGLAVLLLATATGAAGAEKDDDKDHFFSAHGPRAVGLVKEVRRGTARYRDVEVAESEGWVSTANCVSGMDEGAMGVHYVNFSLLFDGVLDPRQPEILIYEQVQGRMRLVGVEFLTISDSWHGVNGDATPVLIGQLFHYSGAPNRYGLPPSYALHVWAWKDNPKGMYVNWNPRVSCEEYTGE